MKITPSVVAAFLFAGCSAQFTHVSPGQSAMFSRAQKGRFVAAPPSAPGPTAGMSAVEPPLPNAAQGETVSDYFALGSFCFQQGRNEEAAAAFRKAVQLDPGYADAWNNLAICYQNAGDTAKALEAFKKYKALSSQ